MNFLREMHFYFVKLEERGNYTVTNVQTQKNYFYEEKIMIIIRSIVKFESQFRKLINC